MSGSTIATKEWSEGLVTTDRTSVQVTGGGSAWIATGATAPSAGLAGNLVPPPHSVEVSGGKTVYWRTDSEAQVRINWLELGD